MQIIWWKIQLVFSIIINGALCSQIYLVNELLKIPKNTFYHEYSRIPRFWTEQALLNRKMTYMAPSLHWICLFWFVNVKRAPDMSSLFYFDMWLITWSWKRHFQSMRSWKTLRSKESCYTKKSVQRKLVLQATFT